VEGLPENFISVQSVHDAFQRGQLPLSFWGDDAEKGAKYLLEQAGFNMERYRLEKQDNWYGWLLVRNDG